jgi:hypothetical protein
MLDRDRGVAGIRADSMSPSCAFGHVGQDVAPAEDGPDPARPARLYQRRGLSTYAIGQVTGLDRQPVGRMPHVLAELYEAGRLGSLQIAAITSTVLRSVHASASPVRVGIPLRHPGGRTPSCAVGVLARRRRGSPPAPARTHPRIAPAIRTVAAPATVAGRG